ncbi:MULTISPECIES: inositol monophosphatase family protein [Micrococcales]|uniref:inositol monophosphatase family protein n=1 Tax=Micrococcales TaxID=85006 RepID=UPI0004AB8F4C|nr:MULTISPECIES: inositol monophosphatase family protein [Micrococcales]
MKNIEELDDGAQGTLALIAYSTAAKAADLVGQRRGGGTFAGGVQTKSSETDLVTEVDRASEILIRAELLARRPQDTVKGEENVRAESSKPGAAKGVAEGPEEPHRWIVDPIDGTVNFVYGLPAYAVSIGCERDGQVVAGAVADVTRREFYVAARGKGAYLVHAGSTPPERLGVGRPATLGQAMLATGFSYSRPRRQAQAELMARILPQVRDIRRFGAAALDACFVARGWCDAYVEHGISGWDYAAASLVAEEAGGLVRLPALDVPSDRGELTYIASPSISEELEAALRDAGGLDPIPERAE